MSENITLPCDECGAQKLEKLLTFRQGRDYCRTCAAELPANDVRPGQTKREFLHKYVPRQNGILWGER